MIVFDEYLTEDMTTDEMLYAMMKKGYKEEKAYEYVLKSLTTGSKISFNMMAATGNALIYQDFKQLFNKMYWLCNEYSLANSYNWDKEQTPVIEKVKEFTAAANKIFKTDIQDVEGLMTAIDKAFGDYNKTNYNKFTSSEKAKNFYKACDVFLENQSEIEK